MSYFEDPKKLDTWKNRAKGDRSTFENTWQEIADHSLGIRQFTSKGTPGRLRTELIYDTTAMLSNDNLAGALQGLVSNTTTDFIDVVPEDPALLDDLEVALWCEDTKQRMLHLYRSAASGFNQASGEMYADLPGFGMGAISVLEAKKRKGVYFVTHPLSEVWVDLNEEGKVDTVFREYPLSARNYARAFPNDNDKDVAKALLEDPERPFMVHQCIAPSDDPYAGKSPFRKAYTSVIWSNNGSCRVLSTGGFDELPLLTPRWNVDSGEKYGRGPGYQTLPVVKMLNEMMRTILKSAQKVSDPPLLITNETVLSKIRTYPGGVNIIQKLYGQSNSFDAIRPLQNNARLDISVELLRMVQQQVKNAFHAQLLQMYDDPRMSATQIIELSNQVTRLLAGRLGRIEVEWLEPCNTRTFRLMAKQGMLLPAPQVLRGRNVKIAYMSPVTRAQRQSESRAAIEVWQAAALIAQATGSQESLEMLDPQESMRIIVHAQAAPKKMLRDARAFLEAKAKREEAQGEEREMAMVGQGSEAAQKIGAAVKQLAQAQGMGMQEAA